MVDLMQTRNFLLLAGWVAFFALAYVISQSDGTETKVYDPFEILGLSSVCFQR